MLAAVCGIAGSLVAVTEPALSAGFASAPLLIVLSMLPVALALSLVLTDQQPKVAGALAALAMFAVGQLLSDLQFAVDVSRTARPELAVPTSLDPMRAGSGLWFLVARHLLVVAAAAVAVYHQRRAAHRDDVAADASDLTQPGTGGQGRFTAALALAVLVVVALLLSEPFSSDNVYLVGASLFEQPPLVLGGGLAVTVAALVSTVLGGGPDPVSAGGWAAGAAVGLLLVGLPPLIAGLATSQLHPSWGPYVLIIVAIVLGGMAIRRRADGADAAGDGGDSDEVDLPTLARSQLLAGVLGVLSAVAALIGSFVSPVVLVPGLPQVRSTDAMLLWPAGLLVGVLATMMFVPTLADRVRPALAIAWVAIPMVVIAELDFAFTALQVNGVRAGLGTWASTIAALLAVASACCVGLAGIADDDTNVSAALSSTRPMVRLPLITVIVCAAGCSISGFGLPLLSGSDHGVPYQQAGVLANFRLSSWGLVLAAIAVLIAVVYALFCPPAKAVALWLGSTAVLGVHLLGVPAVRTQLAEQPGPAAWLSGAAIVLLLVATGLALALPTNAEHAEPDDKRSVTVR